MRLLIITQGVDKNDPVFGFFHRWLIEFAKHVESLEVICLYEGVHELPANVRVHSLGKKSAAKNGSLFESAMYAMRFLRLVWKLRNQYDEVFVHMNPEYVLLAGIFWKWWKKRVGLWYLHKSVTLKLRIAEKLVDVIFTASKESFRLPSNKVQIVGHGIDTETFVCNTSVPESDHLRLVTVGRVTRAKNLDVLIEAARVLGENDVKNSLEIIGVPVRSDDVTYAEELAKQISQLHSERVSARVLGSKTQEEVLKLLCGYDMFIHASTGTGSIDKAVLEALACGVPVVSTSEAFKNLLLPSGLYVTEETPEAIASAIMFFVSLPKVEKARIRSLLHDQIAQDYSLSALVPRILGLLEGA